jgi:hypothetical protein
MSLLLFVIVVAEGEESSGVPGDDTPEYSLDLLSLGVQGGW